MGSIPKNSSFEMCKPCSDAYTELVGNPEKYKIVLNNDGIKVIRFDMLRLDKSYLRNCNLSSYYWNRVEHFCGCIGNSGNKIILTNSSIAYLVIGHATPESIEELEKRHEQDYSSHIYIK